MKFADLQAQIQQQLTAAGGENAYWEAVWILEEILGVKPDLYSPDEISLSKNQQQQLDGYVQRRQTGEPLAYIFGYQEFYGQRFAVTPDVLIPRPETELLVENALAAMRELSAPAISIIDLGAGSGCIGLSLLQHEKRAKLLAVDISAKALEVATENARRLHLQERVKWSVYAAENLTAEHVHELLGGPAHVIVANPPYLARDDQNVSPSVVAFEPHQALFSDNEGRGHLQAWAKCAAQLLQPNGLYFFEIGHDQGEFVNEFLRDTSGFDSWTVHKDYAGHPRWVECRRTAEEPAKVR